MLLSCGKTHNPSLSQSQNPVSIFVATASNLCNPVTVMDAAETRAYRLFFILQSIVLREVNDSAFAENDDKKTKVTLDLVVGGGRGRGL